MSLAIRIKKNLKAFHMYIRSKRVARERVGLLQDKGGNLCMETEGVGKVLNKYFISVFTKKKGMDDGRFIEGLVDALRHVDIKKKVVLSALKTIKVDKYPGLDGILGWKLKETMEEIAEALTEIFVFSIARGLILFERQRLRGDQIEVYKIMREVHFKVGHKLRSVELEAFIPRKDMPLTDRPTLSLEIQFPSVVSCLLELLQLSVDTPTMPLGKEFQDFDPATVKQQGMK
eukprot:g34047.t1